MSKFKKPRGSAVGLVLVSMLAFGAFAASAAQASPVWHVDGKTLEEAGLSKVPVNTVWGDVTIDIPAWESTINCSENDGSSYVTGESTDTVHIYVEGCSVENDPFCQVAPMALDVYLGLSEGGGTGVIETFTPHGGGGQIATLKFSGELCPFNELEFELNYESGSLGAEVGAEGYELPLAGLSSYEVEASFGENVAHISLSGSGHQSEASGVKKLGAW